MMREMDAHPHRGQVSLNISIRSEVIRWGNTAGIPCADPYEIDMFYGPQPLKQPGQPLFTKDQRVTAG